MENMYTDGNYLKETSTWHSEDSPWKSKQIKKIIDKNFLKPMSLAEIGCGSGSILDELSNFPDLSRVSFEGYDISPQAIRLAKGLQNENIKFFEEDLLADENKKVFDILTVIDVFEHVPNYLEFVEKCRSKATYKIYHIPLDIHVSSVLRRAFTKNRYTIGHIHYFSAESALCTLKDTGHEIVDYFYTNGAFGTFKQHPSFRRAAANIPRWLLSQFSVPATATIFGGYSLLVLAK